MRLPHMYGEEGTQDMTKVKQGSPFQNIDRDKAIIELKFSKGETYDSIATLLGISRSAVAGAIYRYRKRNRKEDIRALPFEERCPLAKRRKRYYDRKTNTVFIQRDSRSG